MNKTMHKSMSEKNLSFMSTMASTNQRKPTATEVKILKVKEKYRPFSASKENPCPSILVKPTKSFNIKINKYFIEEETFGLRPFSEAELKNLFSLKEHKK
jgi:hypothetical protein